MKAKLIENNVRKWFFTYSDLKEWILDNWSWCHELFLLELSEAGGYAVKGTNGEFFIYISSHDVKYHNLLDPSGKKYE